MEVLLVCELNIEHHYIGPGNYSNRFAAIPYSEKVLLNVLSKNDKTQIVKQKFGKLPSWNGRQACLSFEHIGRLFDNL